MAKNTFGKQVVTPKGRASYPFVFAPDMKGQEAEKKFKLSILFKKDDPDAMEGMKRLKAAVLATAREAWGEATKFSDFEHPFKDGDESDRDNYMGHWVITAKSKNRPGVVNSKRELIDDDGTFYAGCYCRASIVPFSYDKPKKGITFRLQNVQKLADGEPFGAGRTDPTEDFNDGATDTAEDDDDGF